MTYSHKRRGIDLGTEDRISDLPRNLTDCILERMPIRDAVRTSILSRKWRYIWATQPQLVLDKTFFKENVKNKPSILIGFVSIINRILLLHSGPILKFKLYIPDIYFNRYPEVDQWLLFVSRNGIKELTLLNSNNHPYELPSYIFSCPALTHLRLYNCVFKPPAITFGGFQNLTNLCLQKIVFVTYLDFVPSSPLLEKLAFATCTGVHHFNIRAPKLQVLSVINCHDVKWGSFINSTNLTTVKIELWKMVENPRQGETINLVQLLGLLSGIVNLTFDGFSLKLLAAGTVPKMLPTMANHLKYLKLSSLQFTDLDQMSCVLCLLRSSPNLWKVEIQASLVMNNVMEPVLNYLEAPDCLDQMLNQLQIVRVSFIEDLVAELIFIKLLLARSPSLEKVIIEQSGVFDAHKGFRISKELMRFSRASTKVQIIYLEPPALLVQ